MSAKKTKAPAKKAPAKKMGRPTVFTQDVIAKIEQVAALDGTVEEMAFYAGISARILYQKLKEDEDFSQRIEGLRNKPVLKARETIVNSLSDPNHAKWYIERKNKKEFAQRTEHTGEGGEPITFEVVKYAENTNPPSLPATPISDSLT